MADHNPYVGPASFGEKDRDRFFGRGKEARELLDLLIARPAVLLYAQSGAGKTSLLQAKVIPDLQASGEMRVLPITRVSGPAEGGNVYVANALTGLHLPVTTLTDALAPYCTETQDGEEQLPHLLIFDQFEEIFTFHPELAGQRRAFFEQLRDCLAAYPKLGVLLSIREDYLADMDSFSGYLPDRLRTRMRMEQLSDTQAEDAIGCPAADAGKPFAAGMARHLVDDLRRLQTSRKPSASATDDGPPLGKYVEPVQLQIVCRQLWAKLPDDATTITAKHIDTLAGVNDALTTFYRDALTAVRDKRPDLSERTLRHWFGERLITSAKTRGMVYQEESETEGLPNAAVEVLREKYLLRADIRPSGTWYELAHDRLVEPILADNLEWRASYKNPVADAMKRSDKRLLDGSSLKEALEYERAHPQELTPEEEGFLRESEEEEQKVTARRRKRIGITACVMLVLLALTGWAYNEKKKAEAARQAAEAARQAAEAARQAAEAAKDEAVRLGRLSLAQTLAVRAPIEQEKDGQDELGALLARQASLFYTKAKGKELWLMQIALKQVLAKPYFSHSCLGPSGVRSAVAFSSDGTRLAAWSWDGSVQLWDTTNRTAMPEPTELRGFKGKVSAVAFSSDGTRLAAGSEDGTIQLWDTTNRTAMPEPTELRGFKGKVSAVAFSSDGTRLAAGSEDGTIQLWDTTNRTAMPEPTELRGFKGKVSAVAFSSDGARLAAGSEDGTIRLWDTTNRTAMPEPTELRGFKGKVSAVAFSSDGARLAAGSEDGTIRLWDTTNRTAMPRPTELRGFKGKVSAVAFSSDGTRLAAGSEDGTIQLWDTTNRTAMPEPTELRGFKGKVSAVAFSSDGARLAAWSWDGSVRLWDMPSPASASTELRGFKGKVSAVAFSPGPDGARLAAGSWDGPVRLWDTTNRTADPTELRGPRGRVNAVAFSPDGARLAAGSEDGPVRLWDMKNRTADPTELRGPRGRVSAVAFSSDGARLAAGSWDGPVRLWDMKNRTADPTELRGPRGEVSAVAFSPDSTRLAAGSWDGSVWLWDMKNLTADPTVLAKVAGEVNAVAFSFDGTHLAAGIWDGPVRLWKIAKKEAEKLDDLVCQKVTRNLTMDEWRQFIGTDLPYELTCGPEDLLYRKAGQLGSGPGH